MTVLLMQFLAMGAQGAEDTLFGPYKAISIDSEVIRGVKVDEAGKIWILLNPEHRDEKMILRISEEEDAGYRKWYTGKYDLVSPANQDKQVGAWTDWIETKSRYIEYWMGNKKVLHLKKVK